MSFERTVALISSLDMMVRAKPGFCDQLFVLLASGLISSTRGHKRIADCPVDASPCRQPIRIVALVTFFVLVVVAVYSSGNTSGLTISRDRIYYHVRVSYLSVAHKLRQATYR